MSQIAVRLSEEELRQLDSLVDRSSFPTRAEAVRAAIRNLVAEAREQRIASAYARAYSQTPLSGDEQRMLDAASALSAELAQ
ncbi:MAG TPA: ribbon-helix-helix domain-containing protein [Solirubrobacteraceae bacterium]|jgi:Arc/MetJ-type ribon-helix-helix transcriptional regulator|nr:ribbon-helix-helix domain-containing protein [Solirubrobacteraceae bacterium]